MPTAERTVQQMPTLEPTVLDLFSGIGGFSLGLERAGMRTVAFCEIEPFCRRVLAKHWPGVPCYEDVRELTADRLRADGISVDLICGGFPCQDISLAGRGAGISGARSGLWREYARLIEDFRPRFVIIENSPALRVRGGDQVLSDLEALGYACEPAVVGALHAGAPHRRQRAWLIAYADCEGLEIVLDRDAGQCASVVGAHSWTAEPDVGRVAYGVPGRVDRIRALGNAVVPQIAEAIGRAIMKAAA
jgi:DNA (cytosine-5)-methyltransferase 1